MRLKLRYASALTLLAVACDFGASKFTVVSGGGGGSSSTSGGDGDSTTGDSDSTTGDGDSTTGDGDSTTGDGDSTTGDGDSTTGGDGDGSGGQSGGDGDGAGGANMGTGGGPTGPTGTCINQGQALLVYPGEELQDADWSDFRGALVTPVGTNRLAVLMELQVKNERAIYFRTVSDQNNWVVEPMPANSPFTDETLGLSGVAGAIFRPSEIDSGDGTLLVVGRTSEGVSEIELTIQGESFDGQLVPTWSKVETPGDCMSNGAHIRNIVPHFAPDSVLYSLTCQSQMDELRAYVHVGMPAVFQPLGEWEMGAGNQIINFVPFPGMPPSYFFQTGGDFGEAQVRFTDDPMNLPQKGVPVTFDDQRVSALFSTAVSDGSGVFMVGAAVTATDPDAPEFVPADLFAGTVPRADLDHFGQTTKPTEALHHYGSIGKLSDVNKIATPFQSGQFFYYAGENYATLSSVALTMLDKDGNALVRDHVVANEPDAQLSGVALSAMGGSVFVTYARTRNGVTELLGQRVLCGPDAQPAN